jgi:MFS family permease
LLFAVTTNPLLLIGIQLLDGISGSVLGVLTALFVADLTKGTGRFNLAQGFVGTLAAIGAPLSTTLFSLVVENFGGVIGFVGIAGLALSTVLIVPSRSSPSQSRTSPNARTASRGTPRRRCATVPPQRSSWKQFGLPPRCGLGARTLIRAFRS